MTLSAMLETHDEAALSALASVGVVRRATRDLAAGKATVSARDETSATVDADGQDVFVDGGGPGAAKCDCPATGICRHVILAILVLRESAAETGETVADAVPVRSALEDILALSEDDLRKFAGADWDKAIRQASVSNDATVTEDGANLSVQLPDADKPVMVLAGLGLQGAVFKGPKTTKRRVVTAAALVVRIKSGGQSLDGLMTEDASGETLTEDFLENARDAVVDLAGAVLGGGSTIAEERVFDLAISARAHAAPRLTALLRLLARQARRARAHHVAYDDARFLSEAATTCALTHALKLNPTAPALTGVLRRNYAERDDIEVTLVGAVQWSGESGARGARIHAVDAGTGTWYSAGQARGAGMDPSFTPGSVYNAPLWGLATVDTLIGKTVRLKSPRISSDNQIAWDGATAVAASKNFIDTLQASGVLHASWAAARADIATRMPGGLEWTGNSVPVLIAPSSIGDIAFDDIGQIYHMIARDAAGAPLRLTVSADNLEDVEWLHRNHGTLDALLCEATVADLSLRITPVTAFLHRAGDLKCVNLTFDPAHARFEGGAAALGGRIQSFLKKTFTARQTATITGPIETTCHRAFDAVAEVLRFGNTRAIAAIASDAEGLGLSTLASALNRFEGSHLVEDGLRAAYVAGEILKRAP